MTQPPDEESVVLMLLQLIPHMNMHHRSLPQNPCPKKERQLYNHAVQVRHRMEMHDVIARHSHHSRHIPLNGVPQFPRIVALYLCSQPVASVFLPERHHFHQADDGGHTAAALLRRTYNKYFLHKFILYVTRISTDKHGLCHTV